MQVLLAMIVATVAGFLGLLFLFSDPTTESGERVLWFVLHFFVPGFAIGLFFPRAWYVSSMVAWMAVLNVMVAGAVALFRACT